MVTLDDTITLDDIDEALTHASQTTRTTSNTNAIEQTLNQLLDARLERTA
jgi:hypothetical protein